MREAELLDAWEAARGLPPQAQALAWLALAAPGLEACARAALSVGERDRRLFALRQRLLGPRLALLARCPACGETAEVELDIDALTLATPPGAPELTVSAAEEGSARLRVPTAGDLAALPAGPAAAARLLARCVVERTDAAGSPLPAGESLPPALRAAADAALEAADPLAVFDLALACPGCGAGWEAPLDIARCFALELDAWAARALAEVHELARAYGWREAEILALGPRRRQAYLELVHA